MLALQIVCIQCFDAGLIGLVIIFTDIWNGIDYFAAFFSRRYRCSAYWRKRL